MGWETGLGIAFLLVGGGMYQAIQKISGGVTDFMEAYRDARENPPADGTDLAALRERIDGLHDRLERIEERVDFNEELLRGGRDREELGPASDPASEPGSGAAGGGSAGSTNPNEEETG